MAWNPVFSYFLAVSLLVAPTLATICPDSCVCSTTRDGLHRATCSNLAELYKFSLRQKHHNINILDLSHNNITKLDHELDRLTEVVTLDLSTNGIQNLNKFLHNAKKLVHLNLANNRIKELSLSHLPASVSSLDLTNNLLIDVPSNLGHLTSLEHLELEGNPIDCSCENILLRDRLIVNNVVIDNVKCSSPEILKNRSWLELKTKDVCKTPRMEPNLLDMMMGDQPIDVSHVAEEADALKSVPLVGKRDLEESKVIQSEDVADDDDSLLYLKVGRSTSPSPISDFEGSGSGDSTTISDFLIEPKISPRLHSDLFAADEIIPADNIQTTEDPTDDLIEGSGEGSGDIEDFGSDLFNEDMTTIGYEELETHPVPTIPDDNDDNSTTEYPIPKPPAIFQGIQHNKAEISSSTEKTTLSTVRDTTVSEQIRVTVASEVHGQKPSDDEGNPTPHKTGTYVCIAIIVVLLVGLIGFAIVKGQMRKRRDRRLLRQQKRDVEKASKEMVDMNKSLLGKPANIENPVEKKVNGKYELVPTHEPHQKKSENGDVAANGINHAENNETKADSPRDTNQNRNSSKDNNIPKTPSQQETSFESAPASPDSRKDNNSLSSEDLFVPLNDDENPRLNGTNDSDISQPLINGDQNTDSDFLSPSREYVPVYSPDMGRVRIKMTETPKPKTPVLVTRSRSNAGDIIITPSDNPNSLKSTT